MFGGHLEAVGYTARAHADNIVKSSEVDCFHRLPIPGVTI